MSEAMTRLAPDWIMDRVEMIPESGCWIWMGNCNSHGYGRIQVNRRRIGAHRLIYECLCGPVPKGLECDHLCRVRCCVNPAHIRLVTTKENTLAGIGPTAQNAAKTHCIRGHAYAGDNLKFDIDGKRYCKICDNARQRRYRLEKKSCQKKP